MEEYLEKLNFHWFREEDPDIKRWESEKIRLIPLWINKLSLKPFSLNFIFGPRRIGKTIGIKLLIKHLIENKKVKPESIVYIDGDLIPNLEIFQKLLEFCSKKRFEFIFIDEVTSIKDWWKPLKGLIDSGYFENSVITVTGSLSLRIKREAELFPGRRGFGNDVEVMPLSFKEYHELMGFGNKKDEIRESFKNYLKTGGFLGSINNGDAFIREIINAIESEILKLGISLKLSSEIFSSLLRKLPSPISYNSVASDIGIDYKTVRNYLEIFESMYLISSAYWKQGSQISFRKEKKIFFRDPFILKSISVWCNTKFLESVLYENVIQEHLFRRFGEIYYYRNSYEIDCIAGNLKVEVKAGKPHRRYPKNVIIVDEENMGEFLLNL